MFDPDDPRLVYLPLDKLDTRSGLVDVIRDRWWACHPERGLLLYNNHRRGQLAGASPQCNGDERISRMLNEKQYPWAEIRFVPLVLLPINPNDY
jgi:hypothetical protein